MAIFTRWGNEVEIVSVQKVKDAQYIRAKAKDDGLSRLYEPNALVADGGIKEIEDAIVRAMVVDTTVN